MLRSITAILGPITRDGLRGRVCATNEIECGFTVDNGAHAFRFIPS